MPLMMACFAISGFLLIIGHLAVPAVIVVGLLVGPQIGFDIRAIRLRDPRRWWGFWYMKLYARELWYRLSAASNVFLRDVRVEPLHDNAARYLASRRVARRAAHQRTHGYDENLETIEELTENSESDA
ncbi:hypothetical protein F5B21DRAFT_466732 [Xylaria acuta]|nr:hypothetical protein F5B21DRAFT_466732 [Xylaria acuta]